MTLYPTVSTAPLPRSADQNDVSPSRSGLFEEVIAMNDVLANGSKVVR